MVEEPTIRAFECILKRYDWSPPERSNSDASSALKGIPSGFEGRIGISFKADDLLDRCASSRIDVSRPSTEVDGPPRALHAQRIAQAKSSSK